MWRKKWLKEAYFYLFSNELSGDKPPLTDRLRFFIGTLRILLPLPGKFVKKKGLKFTLGLKCLYREKEAGIYEKDGIKYYIPDKMFSEFFKIYKGIIIQKHYEEPPVMVNKGDVIIDCGASLGITTMFFAKKSGKTGLVVAIEPEEDNYYVLKKLLELNKKEFANIISIKAAVSKEDGVSELCVTKKSGHHFLSVYLNEFQKKVEKIQKVKSFKIDTLVRELQLNKVDFIKMDIEGAEIDALIGAQETIKTFKPKLAICSYHRPTDSLEIKKLIQTLNSNYKYKELEKAEKIIFAWDQNKI